jgi:hypothetical protein
MPHVRPARTAQPMRTTSDRADRRRVHRRLGSKLVRLPSTLRGGRLAKTPMSSRRLQAGNAFPEPSRSNPFPTVPTTSMSLGNIDGVEGEAFGHLHCTAAGVIIPVERRAPWSFSSVTAPSACPAYQGGETRWPVYKRRGRKEGLRSSKHGRGISCAYTYTPCSPRPSCRTRMSRPHPKANTAASQGEGRVYGKGLWKNETEGIEQVSVAGTSERS